MALRRHTAPLRNARARGNLKFAERGRQSSTEHTTSCTMADRTTGMNRRPAARQAVARRSATAEALRRAAARRDVAREDAPEWTMEAVALATARLSDRVSPNGTDFSIAKDALDLTFRNGFSVLRAMGLVRHMYSLTEGAIAITRSRGDVGVTSADVRLAMANAR